VTAHTAFPAVPLAYDGTPQILCRCCNWWLHRDDFRPDRYHAADAAWCERDHGGPVCVACMGDWIEEHSDDDPPADVVDVPSLWNMGRMV
jgi:hypothetical protein